MESVYNEVRTGSLNEQATLRLLKVKQTISQKYCTFLKKLIIIILLKTSGFFTLHQVENSKFLHGARFALGVFYTDLRTDSDFCYIHH
jgi:hypothetical protein